MMLVNIITLRDSIRLSCDCSTRKNLFKISYILCPLIIIPKIRVQIRIGLEDFEKDIL